MKLLKFGSSWCNGCKKQDEILKESPIEVQYVDIEEEEELTDKYNIRSLPTTILLNDNGEELNKWIGVTTLDKILEVAQNHEE